MHIVGTILTFLLIMFVAVVRVALGAVLAIITPVVMPVLALLSGGGLLIAIGFACFGHWHDALKAVEACFACGMAFIIFAGTTQLVNPYAFSAPVSLAERVKRDA